MMEDNFERWYSQTYPDINPLYDDFYKDLLLAYEAGWNRSREVDEALTELVRMAEEAGEYD